MTFSLAACCPNFGGRGGVGAVVASSSVCVAARCLFADARGAALSQNVTAPALGEKLLTAAMHESDARAAMTRVVEAAPFVEWRQLALVDRNGDAAFFNGAKSLGVHAGATGKSCVAVGNLLSSSEIPRAMVAAFEGAPGELPERLLTALEAGEAAGGEAGAVRSAGMLAFAAGAEWATVNLRVDWDDAPIAALRKLWGLYRPQMADYILRAANPSAAPPFV